MPVSRNRKHEWTRFELHTMLCLIARGVHLEQYAEQRTDGSSLIRHNVYENFYTELNDAVNLKDYTLDIHKKEVARMLDQMLRERKSVVGLGGLVERQLNGRVTRSLRIAWNRTPAIGFDGSLSEWKRGRKQKVLREWEIQRGLIKETAEEAAKKKDAVNKAQLRDQADKEATGPSGQNNWSDTADPIYSSRREKSNVSKNSAMKNATVIKPKVNSFLDSFRILPSDLRTSSKYDWADLNLVSAKAGHAQRKKAAAPTLKRAGRRSRVLSGVSADSSPSSSSENPACKSLSHKSSRPGATSSKQIDDHEPSTPRTPTHSEERRSASNTDNELASKSSTPDLLDESSSMDMSLDLDTPVAAAHSNKTRIQSSDMSPLAAFNAAFENEIDSEYVKMIRSGLGLGKDA